MKRKVHFVLLLVILIAGPLSGLTIKLGTLVPAGSPWELYLKNLAGEWARISQGQVSLKIYSGGRAGDESDMIRKMRFNQLQAAGLSVSGLAQIYPGVLSMAAPTMIQTEEELAFLLEKTYAHFDEEFQKQGFKLLFWTTAGWAYVYSRDPVITVEDLRRQKLWIMTGNHEEMRTWQKYGFRPVMLSIADLMVQLSSGGVDAMVTSPMLAASNQWFATASHQAGFRYAPFFGAFIISMKTWNLIPADLQEKLQQTGEQTARLMQSESSRVNEEANDVMEEYGLVIHKTPDSAVEEWREFFEQASADLLGDKFDLALFELVKQHLREFRSQHGR